MNEKYLDKINDLTDNDILSMVMDYIENRSTVDELMENIAERCEQSFIVGRDAQRESDAKVCETLAENCINSKEGQDMKQAYYFACDDIKNNTGEL